ncbi:MAG: CoA transferase, partial [Deltaproteobacteria bacterium]|nr:CoA transferase [Deltaproteobacteria bacterium]
ALCSVMERPELLRDERFTTLTARLAHQDDVDAQVTAWTKDQDLFQAEAALQARGVPASAVRTLHELYTDPQLLHRGHFVDLEHPTHGKTTVEGSRFRLSRTPAQVGGSAPTFGRDNQYVLETILGYSEEKITELVAAGALE